LEISEPSIQYPETRNQNKELKNMLGTIVNVLAIIGGSLVGMLLKGGIPKKYTDTIMQSVGLAVILIGLKGAFNSDEILLIIFSLAIGSAIGEFLRIEDHLESLGKWLESRFSAPGNNISKGFVTASLLYCVGSMAIVGSLESGLTGNHQTLFAKSVLDGISSVVFASSFGIGVLFSAISVLLYQGMITMTASLIKPFLIPEVISQMSATGGLLIAALGFNILEYKRIKVGNMLPAILIPLFYFMIKRLFGLA
jgi:uncharacterized membrane protein YqgA involved in biofilm formation